MRKRASFNSPVRIWLRPLGCGFYVRLMSVHDAVNGAPHRHPGAIEWLLFVGHMNGR